MTLQNKDAVSLLQIGVVQILEERKYILYEEQMYEEQADEGELSAR